MIMGDHGNLGAAARFAGRAFDFDDAFVNFRHFLSKQLNQHTRMGARQNNLRAAAGDLDADDISANPVALAITLARHLFFFRQDGVGTAEIYDDVALFEALHNPVDQLPFPAFEFVVNDFAFGVAYPLHNVLFGSLRGDAAEQA